MSTITLDLSNPNYKEESKHLKVGDILIEKGDLPQLFLHGYFVDIAIIIGQFIAQKISSLLGMGVGLSWEDAKTDHVYQVVEIKKDGDVLVADAMPSKSSKLRIISLFQDRSFKQTYGSSPIDSAYKLEIVRLNDAMIAEQTARQTRALSTPASYLQLNKKSSTSIQNKSYFSDFSFKKAIIASFSNYVKDEYSFSEKKRMMKQYIDFRLQTSLSSGGKKPRKFFCSYFISQQLLGANINKFFDKNLTLKEKAQIDEQIKDLKQSIESLEYKNSTKQISQLAKQLVNIYGDRLVAALETMDSVPKLQLTNTPVSDSRVINPKYTSPQLFAHMLQDKKIGTLVAQVLPQKPIFAFTSV